MLKRKLENCDKSKYYTVYFDAYFYKDSYQLLQAYAQAIISEIEKHEYFSGEFKKIINKIINIVITRGNSKLFFFQNVRYSHLDKLALDLQTRT